MSVPLHFKSRSFSSKVLKRAYTFDDVLLLPAYSQVMPSETLVETSLSKRIPLKIPILSAAMDTVTEHTMAMVLARLGGMGVIHKNLPAEIQAGEVRKVKRSESGIVTEPVTISPSQKVKEAVAIMKERGISGLPIVEGGFLKGLLTGRDVRFETNLERPVSELMTPREKLVVMTLSQIQMTPEIFETSKRLLHEHRIEKIPVVNEKNILLGLITRRDLENATQFPLATKDKEGRLVAAAACGVSEKDLEERIPLLAAAGCDVLVLDTAHGHSKNVIEACRGVRKKYGDKFTIVAGNIATGEAAIALADAGADVVKVGIGPGSICTTRVVAGIGVPQLSAIMEVADALHGSNVGIIADGGIKYSGDIVKALAAGAHCVMVGNLLAGTEESPGERLNYRGKVYKRYRGMGSLGAMRQGSKDRYFQTNQEDKKLVPEGVEGMVPYRGPVGDLINQLVGGIRAGLGYTGSRTIGDLQHHAQFIEISNASLRESHVHDVVVTEEAPNYSARTE